ncbi:hypothetical protein LJB42_003462 [Komagataella kurtzmanii]|nr:hypothetical protein LJB42_003462 [Komagataella kurtzmanii]
MLILGPLRKLKPSPFTYASKWMASKRTFGTVKMIMNQHKADELILDKSGKKPMTVQHELPDPSKEPRRNKIYFIAFVVVMGTSLFGIFNYEKVSSPIMNSTMYFLRRSQVARDLIGKEITFAGIFPWVKGPLNTMKGDINFTVNVSGDKSEGVMRLVANRDSRHHAFEIRDWTLTMKDGTIVDLTKDQSINLRFN